MKILQSRHLLWGPRWSHTNAFLLAFLFSTVISAADSDGVSIAEISNSGWFGTAKTVAGGDIAMEAESELARALQRYSDEMLPGKLRYFVFDGGESPPEAQPIAPLKEPDGSFSLTLRGRNEGTLKFEERISSFVKLIAMLQLSWHYEEIWRKADSEEMPVELAISEFLELDFEAYQRASEFYSKHWVQWCKENSVVPDGEPWGIHFSDKDILFFRDTDIGMKRIEHWSRRIQEKTERRQ